MIATQLVEGSSTEIIFGYKPGEFMWGLFDQEPGMLGIKKLDLDHSWFAVKTIRGKLETKPELEERLRAEEAAKEAEKAAKEQEEKDRKEKQAAYDKAVQDYYDYWEKWRNDRRAKWEAGLPLTLT